MDERVKNILEHTKGELTEDSAAAIICLEDEIFEKNVTVELLKKGELIAIYGGDKTKPYNLDKFVIKTKGEIK
jgi:tRNA(Ile2) C34 agmatinyltransferase TiaS